MYEINMEQKQIFEKRAGTTDRGTDYEHLYVANLILKLTVDDRVENYYLSSNDKEYGSFDDVVLMVKYCNKEETEVYAMQLKQSKNKVLRANHLTTTKGNFSIVQYLGDYVENLKTLENDVKMIIYTNRKAQLPNEVELDFEDEKFRVGILSSEQNDLLETSKQGVCHVFEAQKYESFFRNFFVYSSQADVDQIEQKLLKFFQERFGGDESIFKDYVSFITKWSMKEGNKEKLDKVWMQQVIAMRVLSPFVKPLTFDEEVSVKAKTFRDAASKFRVTILQEDNYDKIKNLWEDVRVEDFVEVNGIRTKFQIKLGKIVKREDLTREDKETSKLLWLLGKCPLVVKDCPFFDKILKMCRNNFIILSPEAAYLKNEFYFKKLSDLEDHKGLYVKILATFTYSIEGQKETPLETLIQLNDNVANLITTDDLVQMLEGPLTIGTRREVLQPCHITRGLPKILVHPQFFEQVKDTLVLISGLEDMDVFQETLKDVEIVEVSKGSHVESCVTDKMIYVSRNEYSEDDFDQFCVQNRGKPKCHQFRYLNNRCLEWIRSKNGVDDLKEFLLSQEGEDTIDLEVLLGDLENGVNVVCGNSGMGKTTLMKSLKTYSSSSVWTILILVRNHALQLRRKEADNFLEYLLQEELKGCHRMGEVFKTFVEKSRLRLIWDGLDEVSDESLEDILNVIDMMSRKGIRQWVTSRNNLKLVLETRFKTLVRQIQHFNIKEQRMYIKKRLGISEDEVYRTFVKIKTNIQPFSNSDILGIPLQIYMLTELFCRNMKKYSDLFTEIFTMLDLYENFVEEKFRLYYTEKIKYDLSIETNYQKYREEMNARINCYKKVAFNLYLRNSSNDSFLDEIKKGDPIGFISTVSKDNVEFSHNSFGEYFAALYLFSTNPQKSKDKKFVSNQKFNNIRFFLDLMLSQNSKAHIAVLYKNSALLNKCGGADLNCEDKIGRSVLEVACAWSKHYKVLDFKENTRGQFDFQHKYMNDESTTKLSYKDISKHFRQIDNVDIRIKRLMFLLPSFIPLYDREKHRFDEKSSASILYYSIKFDYSVIFRYIENISWLKEVYQSFETKCLLSFAMTCKSRQVLEEIVANKQNRDLLSQNLKIILATCKPEFDEVFSLLVKNAVNINDLIFLACWEGGVENVQFLLEKGVKVDVTDACDRMPIHYACDNEKSGLGIVKLLVDSGSEVNVPDIDNQMPLHYACMNDNGFGIVAFMTDRGADVDVVDVDGRLPVHYACDNEEDGIRLVKLLVSKGAKLNVKDINGRMPLHYACMNWKYGFAIVEFLIGQGIDVDVVDDSGKMPIHYACRNYLHSFKIVQLMIRRVDVNMSDGDGCTPIHYACEKAQADTVRLLVTSGARIDLEDVTGKTPIHYACTNFPHGYHIAKLLTDLDADINKLDTHNRTPLHYACACGRSETVRLLVDKGSEIDIADNNGRLPIHFACDNKDNGYDIVKLLISKGTQVDACDAKGRTAMHCACKTGNVYVVKILIDQNAKVDVADEEGKLPIHYACMNWNFGYEIVKLLSGVGARLEVRDVKGRMPMHYACETGNVSTVMLLMEEGARIHVRDSEGHLPGELAQKAKNFNVVRFLNKEKLPGST